MWSCVADACDGGPALGIVLHITKVSFKAPPAKRLGLDPLPVSEPTLSVEQRFCFGKCLSFGFQIDGEVFVRGVDANVAEPVGNRAKGL